METQVHILGSGVKMPQTQRSYPSRRKTMPCSKEDSKGLSELIRSRENLSVTMEDTEKSPTKSVPLQRKSGLNRTDSYRQATTKGNRISIIEPSEGFKKEHYKKDQYKSLPPETKKKTKTDKSKVVPKSTRVRVLRQESGIVPSPDTDEDQQSMMSERKKKTPFQKAKERLVHTFKKDTETAKEKLQKKHDKRAKHLKKRKRAPSDLSQTMNDIPDVIVKPVVRSDSKRTKTVHSSGSLDVVLDGGSSSDQGKSKLGRLASIRKSLIRRKQPSSEPGWTLQNGKQPTGTKKANPGVHEPLHIEPSLLESENSSYDEVNEIFSNLLFSDVGKTDRRKRGRRSNDERNDSIPKPGPRGSGTPDRSKLTLNLKDTASSHHSVRETRLWRREAISPDGSIRRELRVITLHSDVEIDGEGDHVDAPAARGGDQKDAHTKSSTENVPFSELSFQKREKRTSDVANRLKMLADRYVAKIESESGQSDLESPRGTIGGIVSPMRQDMELVQQLVAEFRKEGDRLSQQLDLDSNLTPLILKVARQVTYDSFKDVFKQTLRDTIGWDQIAMYYYVTKTAVHVAGASSVLARMTVDYFKERYANWVSERGGWESMIEETDDELD